jgi:hypothetical protein
MWRLETSQPIPDELRQERGLNISYCFTFAYLIV